MGRGRLRVAPEVAAGYPDYRADVLYATGLENRPSDAGSRARLAAAAESARAAIGDGRLADAPHVAAWRATFSSFGAKPSRYPSSVEALVARSLREDGEPPTVNLLVDAYNAISIEHLLPIGGEDWDRLAGDGILRVATGEERFVVFHGDGEDVSHPKPGEIVWADDEGVTCRRWNWRQCRRTQLTETTTSAYFLLEAIGDYGDDRLAAATDALSEAILSLSPGASIERERIGADDAG